MNLLAFKAYDIRGAYPDDIDEDLAYLVGQAVPRFLSAKTIVVGRDMRLSSPSLAASIIKGLTSVGVDVVDIGICTTPMLNFAVAAYGMGGGIMISASHNPGGDNAFKIINKDIIQIDDESGLADIKALVAAGLTPPSTTVGEVSLKDILEDYSAHIRHLIGTVPPLKIVADYGNGVGAIPATKVFTETGMNLTELYAKPDGSFPNHPANPHNLVNFNDLIAKVTDMNADLGLFFDGDADRVNFVDDLGRIVPMDLMVVLLAQDELAVKKSGNVYFDLRFSKSVPKFIKQAGGSPVMMRVGNPYYKQALRDDGGVMGAEFAGHIMFPENFNIDDGLFAALKAIKMIGHRGKKLSALIDEITEYADSAEVSVEAADPRTVLDRLIAAYPDGKQVELDGLYLDFGDDGFISVRQSQNELQLFRIRVEAKTDAEMQNRFDNVKSIVLAG